jgi:hypothetical protein
LEVPHPLYLKANEVLPLIIPANKDVNATVAQTLRVMCESSETMKGIKNAICLLLEGRA